MIRKTLILIMCILAAAGAATAKSHLPATETLTYRVMYKWGMVNKQAGTATLSMQTRGDRIYARLTARSQPWADKWYKVRDTLNGVMARGTLLPLTYEKIAHEGDDHGHDVVRFERQGSKTIGHATRKKWKKGKQTRNEARTLEAYGTAVDMLSSFYYMRNLDYASMTKGHPVTVNIFSGKQKELLTFKYMGAETVSLDKHKIQCYHVTFIFTGDGGKTTSDNMDAWISVDQHIPIKLEGKLKVGKVQCFLQQ